MQDVDVDAELGCEGVQSVGFLNPRYTFSIS